MNSRFVLLLLLIFTIPAIFSLLRPGFFLSDDGEWMIIRFSAFHEVLADGQFPVRYLSRLNHEYGYPVANFLYPGFMYLAEPIHLLGFGFVNTTKIIFGLSMIGSVIFSFYWLAKLFDKRAAFVGALFYLYTPYHLFDLYKRGSIGEILALAIVPFIFWQIERKSFFATSMGICFLIISHNTLALLFFPVVSLYMIIRRKDLLLKIYQYIGILVIGTLLASFFWIPAVLDLRYTKFLETQVSNWQNHFADLQLVGVSTLFVFVLAAYYLYKNRQKFNVYHLHVVFLVLGVLSIFLSLPASSFLWDVLPVAFVQFPFRFLSVTIVSISFLSAFVFSKTRGLAKLAMSVVLFVLLVYAVYPYVQPDTFFDKGDSYYSTNQDTTNVRNEYMPKWVKVTPHERPTALVEIDNGEIINLKAAPNRISFEALGTEQSELRINKVYFPGWKLYVDNIMVPIFYENDRGVITIPAYEGVHTYQAKFTQSATSTLANLVSLTSLGILFFLAIFVRKEGDERAV